MSPVRYRPNKPELPSETRLWRYFDLDGALNLLSTNTVKFKQLAKFDDEFEGRQSPTEIAQDISDRRQVGIPIFKNEQESARLIEIYNRHHTYASCWTTVGPISMLMWSIYAPKLESLAVETTVGNLIASLPETGPEVLIGTLDYGNKATGVVNSHNPLTAVWSKWDYYEHESEVRLLVDANNLDESHGPRCICQEPESRSIELNPNTFTRVYAHPRMGEDLFESIAARLKSFGGGLRLERADVRL